MQELQIVIGRDYADIQLLMSADPSLPRVMGLLNHCTCFCGMLENKNVVACLLNEVPGYDVCEITMLAESELHAGNDYKSELIAYVADYAKGKGYNFLDVCVGNADISSFSALQRMGFRVLAVERDYYQSGGMGFQVVGGIVNRDMLRYRADFNAGWITWSKEVRYR
jgi:ribosomal protein S18 acetylase RimI-like enzyme